LNFSSRLREKIAETFRGFKQEANFQKTDKLESTANGGRRERRVPLDLEVAREFG